ncbi:MAG: tyrosine-type recombinase/integrase [Actinomycetota bacterium]
MSVTLTPVGVQSPWFSGLRKVRLHDLRHGRASLLLASGTDMALVSKMLGHSSITLTADTYAHLLTGVGRRAADAADALIPRTPRDQSVTTSTPETRKASSITIEEGCLLGLWYAMRDLNPQPAD